MGDRACRKHFHCRPAYAIIYARSPRLTCALCGRPTHVHMWPAEAIRTHIRKSRLQFNSISCDSNERPGRPAVCILPFVWVKWPTCFKWPLLQHIQFWLIKFRCMQMWCEACCYRGLAWYRYGCMEVWIRHTYVPKLIKWLLPWDWGRNLDAKMSP